jgi:hypothetical protein
VCPLPTDAAGLLGTDFLEVGAVIDFECRTMSLADINTVPQVYSVPPAGHTALTVFAEGKAGRNPPLCQSKARRTDEQLSAGLCPEITTQQSESWLVRATENITIAPRCRQIVLGRLESEKEQSLPPLVCVEPAQIPIGVLSTRVLSIQVRCTQAFPRDITGRSYSSCAYVTGKF